MEFSAFQKAAQETSQLELGGPKGPIAPMLGLANETGSILNVYKKYLLDNMNLAANREFLKEELGDLLWYIAAIATSLDLSLEEIAEANLRRTHDRYPSRDNMSQFESIPILDNEYPEYERFPRRLVVEFTEQRSSEHPIAYSKLVSAEPNVFPNGPLTIDGKQVGFQIGGPLGDSMTDNSRRKDNYRFHDAIHMGFMAVLGWSPTMRSLLRLKRKSKPEVDECEDGARAIFAEEGLAAVLSGLAKRRTGFRSEASVDGDTNEIVKNATADLEVKQLPGWLWRKAISQGFVAMHQLGENRGGYLIADLNKRELAYKKVLS